MDLAVPSFTLSVKFFLTANNSILWKLKVLQHKISLVCFTKSKKKPYFVLLLYSLSVRQHLVAEHGADRVVPHVVGDPDPAPEELDGQVLPLPRVEEDAVVLGGGEHQGDVGGGLDGERLHLHVGAVAGEAQARQVLTPLACQI